ncbi:MAG: DNA polymerase III subunit gamma/tau [Parachlamydiales bacterium]|jgi:DNA polymerase-3 subunit gamma/tau
MPEYQVIARRFRPQTFAEVLGQTAIVTTLKNAISKERLASAYLFCGSRGTGKTTLARVFAKALNCAHPTSDFEPCNECPSCREIANSTSIDVLEIDGASHRGIDDVRQINETVGYAPATGKYKIYIIDEVHMLTKEAFNALLKTLEEPPPKVKFLFATTEPHKVLPTILSRCQRFNLNRIPLDTILGKLQHICTLLNVQADSEALRLIAKRAEGGLRDAESLLDQIIAFQQGSLTTHAVTNILGIMPRETLFALDRAGKAGDYAAVFRVTEQLFNEGKDFVHFIEMLCEHVRTILLIKLNTAIPASISLPDAEREAYNETAKLYSVEQCMSLLEELTTAQNDIRFAPSPRFALEALLLKFLRSHHRVPVDALIRRLAELESRLGTPQQQQQQLTQHSPLPTPAPIAPPQPPAMPTPAPVAQEAAPLREPETKVVPIRQDTTPEMPQHRYDTLLQFTAVELEGTVQIKKINRQTSP